MDAETLEFLIVGYFVTILIETPVLLVGLSRRHPLSRRLFAGFWLTACTYPIVVVVLPQIFDIKEERWLYLLVAETFAPVAECTLFWAAFLQGPAAGVKTAGGMQAESAGTVSEVPTPSNKGVAADVGVSGTGALVRDMVAIVVANLASFGIGEAIHLAGWKLPGL